LTVDAGVVVSVVLDETGIDVVVTELPNNFTGAGVSAVLVAGIVVVVAPPNENDGIATEVTAGAGAASAVVVCFRPKLNVDAAAAAGFGANKLAENPFGADAAAVTGALGEAAPQQAHLSAVGSFITQHSLHSHFFLGCSAAIELGFAEPQHTHFAAVDSFGTQQSLQFHFCGAPAVDI